MKTLKTAYLISIMLIFSFYFIPLAKASNITNMDYRFKVLLDDKDIGFYTVKLSESDGLKKINIIADFDVKMLFFSVYTYQHENTEYWDGNCLRSIQATTNDNGDISQVFSEFSGNGLKIKSSGNTNLLSGCVRTFAYWQPELLDVKKLLNSQTGEYMPVTFRDVGTEIIGANDNKIEARRFQLITTKDQIELWYSQTGTWLRLESKTRSGRTLRYELINNTESSKQNV